MKLFRSFLFFLCVATASFLLSFSVYSSDASASEGVCESSGLSFFFQLLEDRKLEEFCIRLEEMFGQKEHDKFLRRISREKVFTFQEIEIACLLDIAVKNVFLNVIKWICETYNVSLETMGLILISVVDVLHSDEIDYEFITRMKIVDFLLDHGANVDFQGFTGQTALVVAQDHGNIRMVEFLLSRGATDSDSGSAGITVDEQSSEGKKVTFGSFEIIEFDVVVPKGGRGPRQRSSLAEGFYETVRIYSEPQLGRRGILPSPGCSGHR
jgi:hypothetical protein